MFNGGGCEHMASYFLNDELKRHLVKRGEVRNPLGINGWDTRMRNIEIKRALYAELSQPCDEPGFEHMTRWQFGIRNLVKQFMSGENRWATTEVFNRLFGRVPLELDVTRPTPANLDLSLMSDEQLATLAEEAAAAKRREIAERRRAKALEAVPVEPSDSTVEPNDLGAAPVGNGPNDA